MGSAIAQPILSPSWRAEVSAANTTVGLLIFESFCLGIAAWDVLSPVHRSEIQSTLRPISNATDLTYDQPTRRMQLWAPLPYDRGRTIAHLHVPLPGVPAPHRRCHQQSGAVPPRAGHLRR